MEQIDGTKLKDFRISQMFYSFISVREAAKKVESIYNVLLPESKGSQVETLEGEEQLVERLMACCFDDSGCSYFQWLLSEQYTRITDEQLRHDFHLLCHSNYDRFERNREHLIRDVTVAYIRNCANHHCINVPVDFFKQGRHNLRYRIGRVHELANQIAAENPPGFDIFRRTHAFLFQEYANLSSEKEWSMVLYQCLTDWYLYYPNDFSWDAFIAKLMVAAHLVCTVIKRNGVDQAAKDRCEILIEVCLSTDQMIQSGKGLDDKLWINMQFLRETCPEVGGLLIPETFHVRNKYVDRESQESALKNFVPLNSNKFMGVCVPSMPRLTTLAYSRLPGSPSDKENIAHNYVEPYKKFEDAA